MTNIRFSETYALSESPLPRASRPFTGAVLKGSEGSTTVVRQPAKSAEVDGLIEWIESDLLFRRFVDLLL
jgi:hypothetical protein